MNKNTSSSKMVATKTKVLTCSTPERSADSPSRDSDSLCDSDAGSPVPFLCTQDGAEGETDVVWNFYTPKSEHTATSRIKQHRKFRKDKPKVEKPIPKRKPVKATQKSSELFQDLVELNRNLHEIMAKKSQKVENQQDSEEDIFNDSPEFSPKSGIKNNSRCLRRNLLSSKFCKPDSETALESDDSINECLIKASQIVEDKILNNEPSPAKRKCYEQSTSLKPVVNFKIDQDSMDAILNTIKLDSPIVSKTKKYDSVHLNNDSFDNLVGNLNDSALERLTQIPMKTEVSNKSKLSLSKDGTDWIVQDLVVHDGSPLSKSGFGRHSSMPESPTVNNVNKPSTSGMVFGRYNSMPYCDKDTSKCPGDSPIRCTPDEIKKKHQQAREKLLAKRLLPFTSTQSTNHFSAQPPIMQQTSKKTQFQPKVHSSMAANKLQNNLPAVVKNIEESKCNSIDLKLLIEKKRQEALMRLRRRQPK